ncbi:universal stress protein [Sinorhizobium sp. BG8]|uniref:universal stress protein n=1 Tax=Sinorhizobium sp. BG8 TaxID=2613773 RepID=UPI00193E8FC6|nr:universal stress protein [Sinorhizobium sp. BG8]QRM55301.1 universal stress protein [Sinorhizobium sp. BG8]
MSYRTIVAVLSAPEDTAKVTEHAVALAHRFDAHVIGIHAETPIVVTVVAPMEYPDPSAILDLQERAREQTLAVEREFRTRCERDGLSHEWRFFTGSAGYASAGIIASARAADLVITAQFDPNFDGPSRADIEDLLYDSGRPLYIVSDALAGPAPIERVLIAWDGSREAARAVFDAMPFIDGASEVEVLCVDPAETETQSADMCGAEIAASLARHGINVTASSAQSGHKSVTSIINAKATESRADLVVMGAYSHSRLRQRLFGGVTSAMMMEARVPVLMSR